MLQLTITLTIAAAAALVNFWLMMRCGQVRVASKVSIGDGGDDKLIRRMRAHANFGESAPIVLILIGALEFTRGTSTWLWIAGIVYILGRLLHPLGMENGETNWMRATGIATTMLTTLVLAGMAFYTVYSNLM